MTYRAPISDILLALNHGAGLQAAVQAGHYGDFDGDITAAVLEEAGKFAGDVLAPLNKIGDENGIKLDNNAVTTAPGWPDAYQRWIAGGWNGSADRAMIVPRLSGRTAHTTMVMPGSRSSRPIPFGS